MNLISKVKSSVRKALHPYKSWWFFKSSPVIKNKIRSHASYSGKYVLTIEPLDMGKGRWQYTRGIVKTTSGKKIAVVERNYSSFPYAFVEHHADGHDYLICGENYQGQTIVQLDTGKRVDYLPEKASDGNGFCWSAIHPSPDGNTLAVEGCYWACPYEVVFYDFSTPMMMPFTVLSQDVDNDEFLAWISPKEARVGRTYELSTKYKKRECELTDEELIQVLAQPSTQGDPAWEEITDEIVWKRP